MKSERPIWQHLQNKTQHMRRDSGSPAFEKNGTVFLTTLVAEDRRPPSVTKTLRKLVTIFDSQGIIHKEFLSYGTTKNAARYSEVLTRFMKLLRRVRPQYAQKGSWFFVHDNACPHAANIVKQFPAKKGVEQIEHPSYSPDLNPSEFFQFPRVKLALKGKRFS
ncbi:histone-lysine N-methyltransferase SETMAR [Trichonephila clavipes]|nr:histone-lysine N-methyltransferase SETMAR [Trichonephila clavipes]